MKTIGLARLGRDAEIRYLANGDAVANLSLAVNYGKKGADGNRPTQWIDAAMYGKQAEALAPYLLKGTVHCFALSDIHIEEFKRQDGTGGTKMVARVDGVELGPRVDGGDRAPFAAPAPRAAPVKPATGEARQGFDDMDDDIPF